MRKLTLATAVLALALTGGLTACSSALAAEKPTATPKPESPLKAAAKACFGSGVDLIDDGHALTFDMEGEDALSGSGDWSDYECLLDALDAPESLEVKMGDTSSLDGHMSEEFNGLEITWSYHPDDGLDFIVEEVQK